MKEKLIKQLQEERFVFISFGKMVADAAGDVIQGAADVAKEGVALAGEGVDGTINVLDAAGKAMVDNTINGAEAVGRGVVAAGRFVGDRADEVGKGVKLTYNAAADGINTAYGYGREQAGAAYDYAEGKAGDVKREVKESYEAAKDAAYTVEAGHDVLVDEGVKAAKAAKQMAAYKARLAKEQALKYYREAQAKVKAAKAEAQKRVAEKKVANAEARAQKDIRLAQQEADDFYGNEEDEG
jgi:hypothetical protein